jgi:hypothetical protein
MQIQASLADKLGAAKEKAAQRDYEVTITETLQMKVTVTAKSRLEAEQMVQDAWDGSEYILDADHFQGVKFDAALLKPELSRGSKGKEEHAL